MMQEHFTHKRTVEQISLTFGRHAARRAQRGAAQCNRREGHRLSRSGRFPIGAPFGRSDDERRGPIVATGRESDGPRRLKHRRGPIVATGRESDGPRETPEGRPIERRSESLLSLGVLPKRPIEKPFSNRFGIESKGRRELPPDRAAKDTRRFLRKILRNPRREYRGVVRKSNSLFESAEVVGSP